MAVYRSMSERVEVPERAKRSGSEEANCRTGEAKGIVCAERLSTRGEAGADSEPDADSKELAGGSRQTRMEESAEPEITLAGSS